MKQIKILQRILAVSTVALAAVATIAAPTKLKTEKPDLEKIRTDVLNPKSEFYYPKLEATYNRNDTTMTPEQFRHFYLGYMFQEDYDPYRESQFDSVLEHFRNIDPKSYTPHQVDSIITFSEKALKDNPFDLRQMSFLIHALKLKGKDYRAKFWEYRLENLLGAIKSTGTGESVNNAWYVVYPMHEYDMAQLLGYDAVDAEYPQDGIDYLAVEPTETTSRRLRGKVEKGFYFNVKIPQQQYQLKHPEEFTDAQTDTTAVTPEADTPANGQSAGE